MKEKIVITGIGLVTPFGIDKNIVFDKITKAESWIKEVNKIKNSSIPSKLGGEVDPIVLKKVLLDTRLLRATFVSQLTLAAGMLCLQDAKIKVTKDSSHKIGIFFATSQGAINAIEEINNKLFTEGPDAVDPLLFSETVFNAPASLLSIKLGIYGPCIAVPMSKGGVGSIIVQAINFLNSGIIDYALVGAAEELCHLVRESYYHLGVLSPCDDYPEGSRPFDKTRNGFVLSEGAAFVLLEKYETAKTRDVNIYSELCSISLCSDGYKLADCDPSGETVVWVINKSIENAGVEPKEIDCILSSASSLKDLDKIEAKGINLVFTNDTDKCLVTSIKGATGTLSSVDLFLSIIVGCLAIKNKVIPPTINYKYKDPECELNITKDSAVYKNINYLLITDCFWGGFYSSVVLKSIE